MILSTLSIISSNFTFGFSNGIVPIKIVFLTYKPIFFLLVSQCATTPFNNPQHEENSIQLSIPNIHLTSNITAKVKYINQGSAKNNVISLLRCRVQAQRIFHSTIYRFNNLKLLYNHFNDELNSKVRINTKRKTTDPSAMASEMKAPTRGVHLLAIDQALIKLVAQT